MILRSSIIFTVLLGFYFFGKGPSEMVNPDKEAMTLQSLIQVIEYVHFSPKKIDDELSRSVYKNYLKQIDGAKRYLTQEDIAVLKIHETQIDEQIKARTFEFFNASLPLLENGLKKAENYFNEMIQGPFEFDKDITLETDYEKIDFAINDLELKERWKNNLDFEVMSRWVQKIERQKKVKSTDDEPKKLIESELEVELEMEEDSEEEIAEKSEEELKADAIKEVKKRYEDFFKRMTKLRRSDRMEAYLGTISSYYDPHTNFFSPKEKEDFDINMGGKLQGIGARLQTDGDETKIFSLVVGGPAWLTKKIEDNDIIIKVAQKGEEPVDITGMRVDDVVQMVRGKKGTTVILTLRKKDNSVVDVSIVRDEVQLEDSKAKSLVLNITGEVQNIGYINLPKFYNSFESDGGNSCAVDVSNEIKKLKSQNVNGIILDLRNNSGGSLMDVVDMTGFFIEDGPIVQVKGREDKPYVHYDKNKEVLYDGPLIIMVNHFSASASEIIAAALQDYKRAIVVGSNSTFGKGTVQRFYDLDNAVRGYSELKPLGNVKMTTQKFYRINGGSTQKKGVVPDIIFPDIYHRIDLGEKEYENVMPWTEIDPLPYTQNVAVIENMPLIKKASESRMSQNENFALILESAEQLKKNRDNSLVPLKLSKYKESVDKRELESKKFENIMKDVVVGLEITNIPADLPQINLDEKNQAKNESFIKDLKKDIYLEETMYILRDMIKNEKSFASLKKKVSN